MVPLLSVRCSACGASRIRRPACCRAVRVLGCRPLRRAGRQLGDDWWRRCGFVLAGRMLFVWLRLRLGCFPGGGVLGDGGGDLREVCGPEGEVGELRHCRPAEHAADAVLAESAILVELDELGR